MAIKGSTKWFSQEQEERIACIYRGKASRSSGAAETDQGDVRSAYTLVECKHTGTFTKPAKSISVKLADMEKICDEAWSENKVPGIALSMYAPDSRLADHKGYVDLMVRLAVDDEWLLTGTYEGSTD